MVPGKAFRCLLCCCQLFQSANRSPSRPLANLQWQFIVLEAVVSRIAASASVSCALSLSWPLPAGVA